VLAILLLEKNRDLTLGQHRIAQLERELRVANSRTLPPAPPIEVMPPHPPSNEINLHSSKSEPISTTKVQPTLAEWRVSESLTEIESLLAIDPQQKQQLRSLLESAYQDPNSNLISTKLELRREALKSILSQALSEPKAAEFLQLQQEEAQNRENEALDLEIFSLSRKLKLEALQEEDLRQSLLLANQQTELLRQELSSRMEQAMASHFDGDPQREELRAQYEQIRAIKNSIQQERNSVIREQLQKKLTDEQLNLLLE